MKLPELPNGYRWEVRATKPFTYPKIEARIKKGWRTKAEGYGHPDISGMETAVRRAVEMAHNSFMFRPDQVQKQVDKLIGESK